MGVLALTDLTVSRYGTTAVEICLRGRMDAGTRLLGQWTLDITGVRDGTSFTGPDWTSTADVVSHCQLVPKNGSQTGWIQANLTYTAVGAYLVGGAVGGAVWDPSIGTQVWALEPATDDEHKVTLG